MTQQQILSAHDKLWFFDRLAHLRHLDLLGRQKEKSKKSSRLGHHGLSTRSHWCYLLLDLGHPSQQTRQLSRRLRLFTFIA